MRGEGLAYCLSPENKIQERQLESQGSRTKPESCIDEFHGGHCYMCPELGEREESNFTV